jgi:predicted nucleotidyltransferase component of viral defense system
MITKEEIISVASASSLLATTVEKDYALSWVLACLSKHPRLSEWVFKGGTCLKKCYFETYRFSEDLDFTVPSSSIYSQDEIQKALEEVASAVQEESGIEIKVQDIEVQESFNKHGRKTFLAKMSYAGPLNLPRKSLQRIKFDITNDEIIVDSPDFKEVFNGYSDAPQPVARVKCYSINEILAEKTRAMYERQGRARDIYDVVNISRNFRDDIDVQKAKICLLGKFRFKSLPQPTVDLVFSNIDHDLLAANWEPQLKHQLQALPPFDSYYVDLKGALSWWIEEVDLEPSLTTISHPAGDLLVPPMHFPEWQTQRRLGIGRVAAPTYLPGKAAVSLDHIRFAARNRLCVEITYHGINRLVEPYSLRRPQTGNLLLYVYELRRGSSPGGGIKAYKISDITSTTLTQQAFRPRYIIEL